MVGGSVRKAADEDHEPGAPCQVDVDRVLDGFFCEGYHLELAMVVVGMVAVLGGRDVRHFWLAAFVCVHCACRSLPEPLMRGLDAT